MNYFANENEIKNNTNLHRNIDYADIYPNIKVAATTYVRPILGKRFFDDLVVKYNANTLTTVEKELVDIVSLVVMFRAADLTLPFIAFKLTNKGPQTQSGDNSSSAGMEAINYLRTEIRKMAHINENELRSFLDLNRKDYPLYTAKENNEIVKPSNADNGGSISFDII